MTIRSSLWKTLVAGAIITTITIITIITITVATERSEEVWRHRQFNSKTVITKFLLLVHLKPTMRIQINNRFTMLIIKIVISIDAFRQSINQRIWQRSGLAKRAYTIIMNMTVLALAREDHCAGRLAQEWTRSRLRDHGYDRQNYRVGFELIEMIR